MIINIYGSTGIIGNISLKIISKYYPQYKINLLCAKNNIKLLATQCKKYEPNFVYIDNDHKINLLKSLLRIEQP